MSCSARLERSAAFALTVAPISLTAEMMDNSEVRDPVPPGGHPGLRGPRLFFGGPGLGPQS